MELIVRTLGLQDYVETWQAMKHFVDNRKDDALDEIWLLEHPPVYTQGLNGRAEHIIDAGGIAVVASDRGGQVTYHGPGQLIVYTMIDLQRKRLGVRSLVGALEAATVGVMKQYGLTAESRRNAPGVYIDDAKIASIGLRIRRGCSYHGLSINVGMDLSPFSGIDPCGFCGLRMIQMSDLVGPIAVHEVSIPLIGQLMEVLDYTELAAPESAAAVFADP
jgi:lipoyl(octanoyl) transferase